MQYVRIVQKVPRIKEWNDVGMKLRQRIIIIWNWKYFTLRRTLHYFALSSRVGHQTYIGKNASLILDRISLP